MQFKLFLYITSLIPVVPFLILWTLDVPIYMGDDWEFIGVQKLVERNVLPIVLTVIMWVVWKSNKKLWKSMANLNKGIPATIDNIENVNYNTLSFCVTYLLPICTTGLALNGDDAWKGWVMLLMIVAMVGIVMIKSDLYYLNPILPIMGYKVYKVTLTDGNKKINNVVLLTQDELSDGNQIGKIVVDKNKVYYAERYDNRRFTQ